MGSPPKAVDVPILPQIDVNDQRFAVAFGEKSVNFGLRLKKSRKEASQGESLFRIKSR